MIGRSFLGHETWLTRADDVSRIVALHRPSRTAAGVGLRVSAAIWSSHGSDKKKRAAAVVGFSVSPAHARSALLRLHFLEHKSNAGFFISNAASALQPSKPPLGKAPMPELAAP